MEKIEPMKCPVCGKKPDVREGRGQDANWYAHCKCGRGANAASKAELAEEWNNVCREFLKRDRQPHWGKHDC